MNCPICGKEMENGSVYSPRGYLAWTPERAPLKNFQRPKDAIRLCPPGDHAPSPLSPEALSSLPRYSGTFCRSCGMVIFLTGNKE